MLGGCDGGSEMKRELEQLEYLLRVIPKEELCAVTNGPQLYKVLTALVSPRVFPGYYLPDPCCGLGVFIKEDAQ